MLSILCASLRPPRSLRLLFEMLERSTHKKSVGFDCGAGLARREVTARDAEDAEITRRMISSQGSIRTLLN